MLNLYENGKLKSTKWRKIAKLNKYGASLGPTRETWRNAEWIGPSFCLYFSLFAFSSFSYTFVNKIKRFSVHAFAPNTLRSTERYRPSKSSGRQHGAPNRPSGAKMVEQTWCSKKRVAETECSHDTPETPRGLFLDPPMPKFEWFSTAPGATSCI